MIFGEGVDEYNIEDNIKTGQCFSLTIRTVMLPKFFMVIISVILIHPTPSSEALNQ